VVAGLAVATLLKHDLVIGRRDTFHILDRRLTENHEGYIYFLICLFRFVHGPVAKECPQKTLVQIVTAKTDLSCRTGISNMDGNITAQTSYRIGKCTVCIILYVKYRTC
jgi:hypothetical protein